MRTFPGRRYLSTKYLSDNSQKMNQHDLVSYHLIFSQDLTEMSRSIYEHGKYFSEQTFTTFHLQMQVYMILRLLRDDFQWWDTFLAKPTSYQQQIRSWQTLQVFDQTAYDYEQCLWKT